MARPLPPTAGERSDAADVHVEQARHRASFHQDVLGDALGSIHLHCFLPGVSEMTAPWGVQYGVPPTPQEISRLETLGVPPPPRRRRKPSGSFFAIIDGSCWLDWPGQGVDLALSSGDLVLLTRSGPCVLRDDPASPEQHLTSFFGPQHARRLIGLRGGGGGATTTFVHGLFFFEDANDNPLIAALPPAIHLLGESVRATPMVRQTLDALTQESIDQRPGWKNVVTHLAHVLFAQAVRAYLASQPADGGPGGLFRALADPELAAAIGAIHAQPADPWTVASLADITSMSRSAFAARFTAAIGESPLQYLTRCRMRQARALLRDGRAGVKEIARAVGYANESAFSNAFKRVVGVAPATFRRAGSD